jgi:UDPglucose 6-dehydrogenase
MAVLCIAGEWHQALVLSAAFAALGHDVRGLVSDDATAAALMAGRLPIHEPGLEEYVQRGVGAGLLEFTASPERGLEGADFVYLAIDTPVADNDAPELESLFAAADMIGEALRSDATLVVTAQVPVGTSERLAERVAERSNRRVRVAYVPEFLRLGEAMKTFFEADRFIIGCDDAELSASLAALYAPLGGSVLQMDVRSAEMTKHASNAFLAASISFANEIAALCEVTGADVARVTAGMKLDRRIGPHAFLSAGLGFAGGTLGRDVRALQVLGRSGGVETPLCDAVMEVNTARARYVPNELRRLMGSLAGRRVAILGMTYKPGTSTVRRSLSLEIMRALAAKGVALTAYDPLADLSEVADPPPFSRAEDPYGAACDADAVVLVTGWADLDLLDFERVRRQMRGSLFIDAGNALEPEVVRAAGLTYVAPGRPRTTGSGVATALEVGL